MTMYGRSTDARFGATDQQVREARERAAEQARQQVVATQKLVTPGLYTFERTKSGTVTTRPATPAELEYPGARAANPNVARPTPGARTEAIAEQAARPQVRVTIIAAPPTQSSSMRKPGGNLAQFTPEYYERLAAQHRQTAVQFGNSQYNLQKARGYELRACQMRSLKAQVEQRSNRGFAPRTKF